jgi:hypothetical protein
MGAVGGRCTLIVGLGLVLGPGGFALAPGRPLHGFGCRHCLVGTAPIGSRGYATGVQFAAHLSRADGSSQVLVTIRWRFRRSGCCSGVSRICQVLLLALCVPGLPTAVVVFLSPLLLQLLSRLVRDC